jgi:transposase-like protein
VPTKSVMGTNGTGRRNRSWPEALKREIVAASFAPGSSVSVVARQYDNKRSAWVVLMLLDHLVGAGRE